MHSPSRGFPAVLRALLVPGVAAWVALAAPGLAPWAAAQGAGSPSGVQPPSSALAVPITLDRAGITLRGTDGVTTLGLRFRVQQLAAVTSRDVDPFQVRRATLAVRRMRLRLDGVLKDPRLRVNVQLSFARGDMDQENTGLANVLRDAYVTWQFTPRLSAAFGQAKLPGNRQRLVSSSELQSPDRSPVNALFTADRDVGAFVAVTQPLGRGRVVWRGAITSGEGRNPPPGDNGLAYTTRLEWLPLGVFTANGDYVEGDQVREPSLRLSLAGGLSRNDRAVRTGGQLGPPLFAPRSMTTWFADVLVKRRGVALAVEYARRAAPDPVTRSGSAVRHVHTGEGLTVQGSWLLPASSWEPQLRASWVTPAVAIRGVPGVEAVHERAVGVARYLHGHRIKTNAELIQGRYRVLPQGARRGEWMLRFGAEVGI
jgi:hypothetical protein